MIIITIHQYDKSNCIILSISMRIVTDGNIVCICTYYVWKKHALRCNSTNSKTYICKINIITKHYFVI